MKLEWEKPEMHVNGEHLRNLSVANDIILFNEWGGELQEMFKELRSESSE